jgi:defect in organelle trafficking protein DotA
MIQIAASYWIIIYSIMGAVMLVLGIGITVGGAVSAGIAAFSLFGATTGLSQTVAQGITAVQTGGQFFSSLFTMFLPAGIAITTPLFLTGLTLAIYVPLIPFMLFSFGVVSWLIFVVEAMAASALIALGVTHPEGNPMLGKAEQALGLLIGIFLRPVMMIIGLVSGVVLSYIAVDIINSGFNNVVSTLDLEGGSGGFGMIKSIMLMVIYTMTIVSMINQCFSLIYKFPDEILKYIGHTGHTAGEAAQLMGEVKAATKPFEEGAASGLQKGAEALKTPPVNLKKGKPEGNTDISADAKK